MSPKPDRKQRILETLAGELEKHPANKITTAKLAEAVGVSEAALYRHFPSKAKMFEGLIIFAEDSVFSRINRLMEEEKHTLHRCNHMLYLLLGFSERNPGIVRLLLGQALQGERVELYDRVRQFFERVETQLKQIMREASMRNDVKLKATPEATASLLTAYIEGRMHRFLHTSFSLKPTENWETDWALLRFGIFIEE